MLLVGYIPTSKTGVYEHTQIESCWFQNKDSTITERELKEYQRQRLVKS